MKHVPNRAIMDMDDKIMDLSKAEQDRIPWQAVICKTAEAIRLLLCKIPTESMEDIEGGLAVMEVARLAGAAKDDIIHLEEADYKFLMKKGDEFGPRVFGYNYKRIKATFEDLIGGAEDNPEGEDPNAAELDGQADPKAVAVR
jgi:hypothetical protein